MNFEIITLERTGLPGIAGAEIVEIWNSAFSATFRLTHRLWLQQTEGDPSFRPSDLWLARDAHGQILGFALAKRFRQAADFPGQGLEKYNSVGYIAAIAVRAEWARHGIGRALLDAAESSLRAEGVTKFVLGGSFRHFMPGLPLDHPRMRQFFEKAGYIFDSQFEYDLDGPLLPEVFGPILAATTLNFRQGQPGDEQNWLSFLTRDFSGRWYYEMQLFLKQGGAIEDITFLLDDVGAIQGFQANYHAGSRVLGPSIHWLPERPEWGGIGPLGISPTMRGKGAGLALVAAGMSYLYHQQDARHARIDWTTLTEFYARLGFHPIVYYLRGMKED